MANLEDDTIIPEVVVTIKVFNVGGSVPFKAEATCRGQKHHGFGHYVEQAISNATAPLILNHYDNDLWSEAHTRFRRKVAQGRV
jgi:hypothetical protein